MPDRQPTALLVTGPPASGKTTVATRLAASLGWPLLAKDDIKEALLDVLGSGDRDWSRQLSRASHAVQLTLAGRSLRDGASVILEGPFRAEHAVALRAMASNSPVRYIQVLCVASIEVLGERLRRRSGSKDRHPGHLDTDLVAELPVLVQVCSTTLDLGGALHRVDTTSSTEPELEAVLTALVSAASSG
jgi:predicted kinase